MQPILTPCEQVRDRVTRSRPAAGCKPLAALWLAVVCGFSLQAASVAKAQAIQTWNVTSGTWANSGSWLNGTVPLTTDTASFSGPAVGSSNATVLLGESVSVAGLSFNSAGTTTLRSDSATARSLTIGTGGISMGSGAGAVTIGVSGSMADIALGGSQIWTNLSTGTLTVAGGISDGGSGYSLTKAGAGTLTLSGSSSFSGGVKLQAGTLRMTGSNALGTGAVSAEGGSLFVSISNGATVSNNITLDQHDFAVTLGNNTNFTGTFTVPAARTLSLTTALNYALGGATLNTISGTLVIDQSTTTGIVNVTGAAGAASASQLTNATVVLANRGGISVTAPANAGATTLFRIGQLINSSTNARLGGNGNATGGGTFVIGDKGGDSSFAGTIADNQAANTGRRIGITKVGAGVFTVSGSNTYQYATTGSGGVLKFASEFALPGGLGSSITGTASNLVIAGGVIGLAHGDMLRPLGTGSNAVQWSGTGGGFAAYGAARTVNFGGSGSTVTWGSGNFVPTGSALVLGHTTADNTITFANGIDLGSTTRTIQVNRGTVDGVDAVLSGAVAGSGGLTKTGAGVLRLSGANGYSGLTTVSAGGLVINGSVAGDVQVDLGARLGGSGVIAGTIAGSGLVGPGNSPGILTASQFNPTGGLDVAFELTGFTPIYNAPSASVNDVLRLTSVTPFTESLGIGNVIDFYFNMDTVADGTYEGGFFTSLSSGDLFTALQNASVNYWIKDSGGSQVFNGINYSPYSGVTLSTATVTRNFGSGDVTGSVTQFIIVPEPESLVLACGGIATAAWAARRRSRGERDSLKSAPGRAGA